VPPIRNHVRIAAVAHRTIPFTQGLTRMPMINSHIVSTALTVPPLSLMDNTYSALKKRVREALLDECARLFPMPGYYYHLPTVRPRPFIGMGKFVAGRIHQVRSCKSYLATHRRGRQRMPIPPAPVAAWNQQTSSTPYSPAPVDNMPGLASSTAYRASVTRTQFGPPFLSSRVSPPLLA